MKILHIDYDDIQNPWLGGGGALHAFEINKRLASEHRVTMATGNYPGALAETDIQGIRWFHRGNARSYWQSRLSFSHQVRELIQNESYDILVEDTSAYTYPFSFRYTSRPKVAIVHHIMGFHSIKKLFIFGVIPYIWEKYNLSHFNDIIVGSSGTANAVINLLKSKPVIHHIPYGFDQTLLKINPGESDYLLFFGRMDIYNKGIDLLLKAFENIQENFPQIRLILAGRGREQEKVKNLIAQSKCKNKISFMGTITEAEKQNLLSQCLMLVMPSRFEGWGIAAVEAQACGKPVVGADIDGLKEAVVPGKTGLLSESENISALAENISVLLQDGERRRRMGQNAREWSRRFSWDTIARDQLTIYQQIIDRNS